MIKDRIIQVNKAFIRRAAYDERFRRALALTLMIKACYVNSILNDYSLRNLQKQFHLGFGAIQAAVNDGIKFGLLKVEETKKGKQLVALKICERGVESVRVHVCDSPYGKQIFFKSKTQNNLLKYQNADHAQSLREVMELILLATIVHKVHLFKYRYDRELENRLIDKGLLDKYPDLSDYSTMCKARKEVAEEDIRHFDILKTGISYQKMIDYFHNTLSLYKVRKLIEKGKEDGLFVVEANSLCISTDRNEHQGEFQIELKGKPKSIIDIFTAINQAEYKRAQAMLNDFIIRDGRGCPVLDLNTRIYRGHGAKSNFLYVRLANLYFDSADVLGTRKSAENYCAK